MIALVITIVVLIILSLISINAVFGENGLIVSAEKGKKAHIIGTEKEAISLAYTSCKTDNYEKTLHNIRVTDEQLQEELAKDGHNTFVMEYEDGLKVTFLDTKNMYDVKDDGNVEHDRELTEADADRFVDGGWLGIGKSVYGITALGKVVIEYDTNKSSSEIEKLDRETGVTITEDGIRYSGTGLLIDGKGKLYEYRENGNKEIICWSDVEGSALKDKKVEEVILDGYSKSGSQYCKYLVRAEDGKIYGWGSNGGGQLGDGTTEYISMPICLNDVEGSALNDKYITKISLELTSFAIDDNGKLYTWGNNDYGVLGDGSSEKRYLPVCISEIPGSALENKKIVQIRYNWNWGSGSLYHPNFIALDENGKVYTWGCNERGQLGNGTTTDSSIPICISDISGSILKDKKVVRINRCGSSMEVQDDANRVYAWGYSQGTNTPVYVRTNNSGSSSSYEEYIESMYGDMVQVEGYSTTIAIDKNGKVYTEGDNYWGQLGDGTTTDREELVCISDIQGSALNGKNIVEIIGYDDTIIVKDIDGKLYGWGCNDMGQLGDGTTTNALMPICISDVQNSALNGVKAEKVIETGGGLGYMVLDKNKKLYLWRAGEDENDTAYNLPVCLSDMETDGAYGEKIDRIKTSNGYYDTTILITESGELLYRFLDWSWML